MSYSDNFHLFYKDGKLVVAGFIDKTTIMKNTGKPHYYVIDLYGVEHDIYAPDQVIRLRDYGRLGPVLYD